MLPELTPIQNQYLAAMVVAQLLFKLGNFGKDSREDEL